MNIKNVSPDCFQGRHWRGICIATIGGQFRINFKTTFDYKDEVKEFCKNHGGTWDAVNRCWFVPVSDSKQKIKDGTVAEWIASAISAFGEGMKIGSDIEWCIAGGQSHVAMIEKLCFKQTKKQALTVIEGGKKDGLAIVLANSKLKGYEVAILECAYKKNQDVYEFARELVEDEDMGSQLADCLHVAYYLDGKCPDEDVLDIFAAAENSGQSLSHLVAI